MVKYKSLKTQSLEERKKRERTQSELQKTTADVDYLAMMCDIELDMKDEKDVGSDA